MVEICVYIIMINIHFAYPIRLHMYCPQHFRIGVTHFEKLVKKFNRSTIILIPVAVVSQLYDTVSCVNHSLGQCVLMLP